MGDLSQKKNKIWYKTEYLSYNFLQTISKFNVKFPKNFLNPLLIFFWDFIIFLQFSQNFPPLIITENFWIFLKKKNKGNFRKKKHRVPWATLGWSENILTSLIIVTRLISMFSHHPSVTQDTTHIFCFSKYTGHWVPRISTTVRPISTSVQRQRSTAAVTWTFLRKYSLHLCITLECATLCFLSIGSNQKFLGPNLGCAADALKFQCSTLWRMPASELLYEDMCYRN